jgi:hypothetical protein
MTTLDDDTKGKSPFQNPVHLSLALLTFTSLIVTLLFLSRSNEMATDIGCLAAGRKGLRKTETHVIVFFGGVHSLFHCRLTSHCTFEEHYSAIHFLWTLPLTLLEPLVSSLLLHSLGHHTSLVIPISVHTFVVSLPFPYIA